MGVSREARAHRVLVLARDVFPGPGNPTGPLAKMAVSGVFDRATSANFSLEYAPSRVWRGADVVSWGRSWSLYETSAEKLPPSRDRQFGGANAV